MVRRRRRRKGQSLIEAMIGFMVLIPIGLAAVNVVCLVSSSQTNEQWAEIAARAAATRLCEADALKAANESLSDLERNQIIEDIQITKTDFDLISGHVSIFTTMKVKLPVPIPGFSEVTCTASSIQPIVSTPAPR
jgi:Flp pilus assembly protein TadG